MPLPRVPKERIVDAVPVALVLIVLSVAWVFPPGAPISMLHLWLWLRHPRSKSRYAIFAAVMCLYLGIFVVGPMLLTYMESMNTGSPTFLGYFSRDIAMHLMIASSAGVLPIFYRLISRCSLVYQGEMTEHADESESRAGISDLLILSFLFSIVFIVARLTKDSINWWHAPTWDLITTWVFSIVGLIAMRVGAKGNRVVRFTSFLLLSIGGYALLHGVVFCTRYLRDEILDNPEWLSEGYSSYGDVTDQPLFLAMLFVAVFPLICRRCGVTLALPRSTVTTATETADAESQLKGTSPSRWTVLGESVGHIGLIAFISMFTLYPFPWIEKYSPEDGYRVAGWPLEYWQQQQVARSDAPWYWTNSEIWSTVDFRSLALVVDLLLTVILWLLIAPPKKLKQVINPRRLRFARCACFVGLMLHFLATLYAVPLLRDRSYAACEGMTIDSRNGNPRLGTIPMAAMLIEWKLLPIQIPVARGLPNSVTFENSPRESLSSGLKIPTLETVTLRRCVLDPQHVDRISKIERLRKLVLIDCQLPPGALDALLKAPALLSMEVEQANGDRQRFTDPQDHIFNYASPKSSPSEYLLNWESAGGELVVPESISELTLVVPNSGDPEYRLTKAPDLMVMELRNTTGKVPDSIAKLTIDNAPSLSKIHLDNCQRVDLTINSPSAIESIRGSAKPGEDPHARLTSLQINGESNLNVLMADVLDCDRLDLGTFSPDAFLSQLQLTGRSLQQFESRPRIDAARIAGLLRQLPKELQVIGLELQFTEFDQNVAKAMPKLGYEFALIDCAVSDDALTGLDGRLRTVQWFRTPGFAPNDRQLAQLLKQFDALWEIHIDGSNLQSLPKGWGAEVQTITIDHLNLDPQAITKYDWANVFELQLANASLTNEVIASWAPMPRLRRIDLSQTPTSIKAAVSLVNQCPNLDLIDLSTNHDPERQPYAIGKTLRLHGRKITTEVLKVIRPLNFDFVDLRGCEITSDALTELEAEDESESSVSAYLWDEK